MVHRYCFKKLFSSLRSGPFIFTAERSAAIDIVSHDVVKVHFFFVQRCVSALY